jgi:hypothetical protein
VQGLDNTEFEMFLQQPVPRKLSNSIRINIFLKLLPMLLIALLIGAAGIFTAVQRSSISYFFSILGPVFSVFFCCFLLFKIQQYQKRYSEKFIHGEIVQGAIESVFKGKNDFINHFNCSVIVGFNYDGHQKTILHMVGRDADRFKQWMGVKKDLHVLIAKDNPKDAIVLERFLEIK